jgi:GH15 family glucan-1,4-alpha-glucosidase
MTECTRQDGYLPIASYALLGDGSTVALVAADGSIDWLPVPAIDAPPAFAALLDPEDGGRMELAPVAEFSVQRRYLPGTAVLETTFRTADGSVTVTDALNRYGDRPLPWTELAREVRAERGAVPMRWRVAPGRRFGSAEPWVREAARDRPPLIGVGDQTLAVTSANAGPPELREHEIRGEFTATPDSTVLLAVTATDQEPVPVPDAADIANRLRTTTDRWQAWQRSIEYAGPHAEAVIRSALTLELLTITATGANAAAATTSLPEAIGGNRNYDYRFAWVRDASFALDALTSLGLRAEVHAVLSWLLRAVRRTAPDIHVMYALDGQPAPAEEQNVGSMPGYLRTEPVYVGNAAASQRQLGCYGHLMDAVYQYVRHGGQLDSATGAMLAEMADKVCDLWRQPDAGLWELGDYRHYTSSKLGCWVALDRAAWLADRGQLPGWRTGRWRSAADEIHRWVDEHCWSADRSCYLMAAGSDQLDAAVLLAGRTGFCAGQPERLRSTISAIRRELGAGGPLLYRYSEMRGKEGAFAACTFWLAEALAYAGQRDEASAVFAEMLGYTNEVGLLSEEIDPESGGLLGNFPQGLSHLALIAAAQAIAKDQS